MTMWIPPLENATGATAGLFRSIAADGWRLLVVVKQAYEISSEGRLRSVPGAALRLGDEPWSDEHASVRFPHDLAPVKRCTDCVVVGDAVAPAEAPVRELTVRVEIGEAVASARVVGPRTWVDTGSSVVPSGPLPFTRAPLRWEHAFGGLDDSNPDRVLEEPRNPLGVGLSHDPRRLVGSLTPHVERVEDPIRDHRSRPAPAGFGALSPSFEPRRSAAGTHDDRWRLARMPMPPLDQDEAFHQVAPPELRSSEPLRGGEVVRLLGLHPRGAVTFELPRGRFLVEAPASDGRTELAATLDTVMLEPNALRCELVWRAAVRWPAGATRRRSRVRLRAGNVA